MELDIPHLSLTIDNIRLVTQAYVQRPLKLTITRLAIVVFITRRENGSLVRNHVPRLGIRLSTVTKVTKRLFRSV